MEFVYNDNTDGAINNYKGFDFGEALTEYEMNHLKTLLTIYASQQTLSLQERIKELEGEWVSVETLPSDRQKILFVLNDGEITIGAFISVDQWGRENMFCDGAFFDLSDVSHWRPLPPPPRK